MEISKERKIVREIEGIGVFTFKNQQLEPNEFQIFDFEYHDTIDNTGRLRKYLPFDSVTIINNSEGDIQVYWNCSENHFSVIPKGTIWVFEATKDIPAIWRIKILNSSNNTISENKIVIAVSRRGMDSDRFVQAISKNVFMKWFLGV
ncbi:MAG: hypothetical protein QXG39_04855 [Candidatus Aenigmatarchaeota archaeon]